MIEPIVTGKRSPAQEKTAFYSSRADTLQTVLMPLVLVYLAWLQYAQANYLFAGLYAAIVVVVGAALWRQSKLALFTFHGDTLEVRDVFHAKLDIPLADIHAIDESPWIGIKVHANFKPYRLLVNRLDADERRTFIRILRQRTGLDGADSAPF